MPGELSEGVVTLLLTDLEGSTACWDADPGGMRKALDQLDELVEEAVAHHGGSLVKPRGEGDSHFIVFRRAPDAVLAAVDVQRRVATATWPTEQPIVMRMAVHVGSAEVRAGDYYGPEVNRCARIRALAHGGQVLVSEAVATQLPSGVSADDLGTHPLRGLSRPERIHQLVAPGLRRDFPPLRSGGSAPTNLPAELSSFVGRDGLLREVSEALDSSRLVSLVGPGGSGKTRVALRVAHDRHGSRPDGTWFIDLSRTETAEGVVAAVAGPIGLSEAPGADLFATLLAYLADQRCLLVLDNCEHVLRPVSTLVAEVLSSAPEVLVMSTSRERLAIAGERLVSVRPMDVPARGESLDLASAHDAVRLFIERARAARPGWQPDDRELTAAVSVCQRLDGIPLAIELATARLRAMSAQQIDARLTERLDLIDGHGARDTHLRTLRDTIDWSYELLDPASQSLFRALSVFPDSFTLEAAEWMGGPATVDHLTRLTDHSLLSVDETSGGVRHRMLSITRERALQLVREADEQHEVEARFVKWVLHDTDGISEKIRAGQAREVIDRFEAEWVLWRAGVHAAAAFAGEDALVIANRLFGPLNLTGRWREGRLLFDRLADSGTWVSAASPHSVMAAYHRGTFAWRVGAVDEARRLLEAALATAREIEPRGASLILSTLGHIAYGADDFGAAATYYQEAVDVAAAHHLEYEEAAAMVNLGIAVHVTDVTEAERLWQRAADQLRRMGDTQILGPVLGNLAAAAQGRADMALATRRLDAAIEFACEHGDRSLETYMLFERSVIELLSGEVDASRRSWIAASALWEDTGAAGPAPPSQRHVPAVHAWIAGDPHRAIELLEEVEAALADSPLHAFAARALRADVLRRLGELDRARGLLESSVAEGDDRLHESDLLSPAGVLAAIMRTQGDVAGAARSLLHALTSCPDDRPVPLLGLVEEVARLAFASGDQGAAARWLGFVDEERRRLGVVRLEVSPDPDADINHQIRRPAVSEEAGPPQDLAATVAEAQGWLERTAG